MILSKKLEFPRTTKSADLRDLTNTIVDSGLRYGVQEWTLSLTGIGSDYRNVDINASETLTVDVAGTTYTAAFNTDTLTTLQDLATSILADGSVSATSVESKNLIKIKVVENEEILVDAAGVTGATRATELTADESVELKLIPAILVVNQDALVPLRTDNPGGLTITYAGFALVGADPAEPVWKIQKITETANTSLIEYADGDENMDNIWDNRAALSYS
tara:strand:+ start:1003 stop:1659 length:657 start_codon:yes stop_codon:yes gene_type:complete